MSWGGRSSLWAAGLGRGRAAWGAEPERSGASPPVVAQMYLRSVLTA